MSRFSAFTDDALGNMDATAILAALREGRVSLVEVTQAAINRARLSQTALHAVTCDDYAGAMQRARGAQETTLLGGLPSFVKDNVDWIGKPTRYGSRAMPKSPARSNNVLTQQLIDSGLNFLGKSATPPFGFGCSTEFEDDTPAVGNPWNTKFSAGGSSGGAAALVASGVVPMAHANDGGGSIRIPAAMCGVVGLKPSRGRLAVQPNAKRMPINIISDGVVTRSVRDTALFFHAAEQVQKADGLAQIGHVRGPARQRRRIGVVYDSLLTKACPETRATVENTARLLASAGHHVDEIAIPIDDSFAEDFTLYWCLFAFSIETFGKRLFGREFDKSLLDPLSLGLAGQFKRNFWRIPGVIRRLKGAAARLKQRTAGHEVFMSPVIARVTPELGHLSPGVAYPELLQRLRNFVGYTPLANITGVPAISLPMGRSVAGLPIGVQLSAGMGQEQMLLELSFELEGLRPWPQLFGHDGKQEANSRQSREMREGR